MNDNHEAKAKVSRGARQMAAGRLPDSLIRRKTASDAVQHPATLVPLALCIMSAVYLLLLSPIFGGGGGAIAVTAVSGTVATASYLYRYNKEYPRVARELLDRLELERIRSEEEKLKQFCETLQAGFVSIASTEGLRALAELTGAYEQLQPALDQARATDPLSLSLIPALAGETYRTGLSLLSDALQLMKGEHTPAPTELQGRFFLLPDDLQQLKALPAPGRERLEAEIARLEKEVQSLKGDESKAERLRLSEEVLASSRERLDMLNSLQLYVDRLLHQAGRCEASLRSTQIELAAVRAGGSKTSVDRVIEALKRTIHQVKEVQDELDRLGH